MKKLFVLVITIIASLVMIGCVGQVSPTVSTAQVESQNRGETFAYYSVLRSKAPKVIVLLRSVSKCVDKKDADSLILIDKVKRLYGSTHVSVGCFELVVENAVDAHSNKYELDLNQAVAEYCKSDEAREIPGASDQVIGPWFRKPDSVMLEAVEYQGQSDRFVGRVSRERERSGIVRFDYKVEKHKRLDEAGPYVKIATEHAVIFYNSASNTITVQSVDVIRELPLMQDQDSDPEDAYWGRSFNKYLGDLNSEYQLLKDQSLIELVNHKLARKTG